MFDTAFHNEPMFQFSVKLSAAVKKHECLHDQRCFSLKTMSPECEAAWKVVAEECEESVENCTWRWKIMRKSYLRTLRKGTNKYYLHEHLEYMIPYLLGSEPEADDKTSDGTNSDIKLPITDDSAPPDEEKVNEETATDAKLTVTDIAPIEEKIDENTKTKENNNKDGQKKDGFDSDTTSADETHIAIAQKTSDNAKPTETNQVGEFIIQEIDESTAKANGGDEQQMEVQLNEGEINDNGINPNDESLNNEDDASRRSRYKRACKRGLDAEILCELQTEKQEEKRPRRSAERRKTLAGIALEEFSKRKSLPNLSNKKGEPKANKPKYNKNTSLKVKDLEQQPINIEATVNSEMPFNKDTPVYQHTAENVYSTVNQVPSAPANTKTIPIVVAINEKTLHIPKSVPPMPVNNIETPTNIFYQNTINQITLPTKPLMKDSSTITIFETRNSSCQYEEQQDALDFDDIFINSLKPQLKLMNGRQKMNFKRKVFQSLMEVFDDASNFPNTNEYVVLPSTGAPRFDTTTNGELRLMRELVSLVQAAKTTPEIINATEKEIATVSPVLEKPSTPQVSQDTTQKSVSPMLTSPLLDDEDLRFITEMNDDDAPLPRSLDEILARQDDDDVLGLPRRVIHKVVKVAGPNGSTIVTGEAGKRRVYRIYPKTVNVTDTNRTTQPKNGGGPGTFYVNPSKGTVTSQQINQHKVVHKANSTNPTITFRTVQKPSNNSLNSPTILNNSFNTPTTLNNSLNTPTSTNSQNSQNKTQPILVATYKTPNSSANTPTQILDPTTGLFRSSNVSTSKTATSTITNNKPTNSPMLPPNSGNSNSNNNNNNNTQRVIVRTQVGLPGKVVSTHSALMQRRYSICGPAPTRSSPIPVVTRPISKLTVSSNGDTVKSGPSQIQISKPVSLNTNAGNSQNSHQNPKPIIVNTNRCNIFSNNANSSTKISTTSPNVVKINSRPFENSSTKISTTTPNVVKINSRPFEKSSSNPFEQSSSNPSPPINQEKRTATTPPQQPREIPVLETAGTISADTFSDPLFVKPFIKDEPLE